MKQTNFCSAIHNTGHTIKDRNGEVFNGFALVRLTFGPKKDLGRRFVGVGADIFRTVVSSRWTLLFKPSDGRSLLGA
jgi:hypothetical protein